MIQFGRLSWYGIAKGQSNSEIDFNSPAVAQALATLTQESKLNKYSITLAEAFRPDRTSLSIYNNNKYFWVLMQVNGILDPWQDWYPNRMIIYPNSGDIASALNRLSIQMKNEDPIRQYMTDAEADIGTTKPTGA